MVLTLEIVKLSAQKPTVSRVCEVHIEDNYMKYFIDFDSENLVNSEDPMLGWTDPERSYYEVYIKNSSITAIEKIWNASQEKWQVNVVIVAGNDLRLYFDHDCEEKADDIFKHLTDWWLN